MKTQWIIYYLPWWGFVFFIAAVVWHFFVKRFIDKILYFFGFRQYSSYADERRGMNEHIRFVRRNFKRSQFFKRKCFFRLITGKDGAAEKKILNGICYFNIVCLKTGEKRWMEEDWVKEAAAFKVISNAEMRGREIKLAEDMYKDKVPEYNKKVGDISYFNMVIGVYSDWSIVKMDVNAVTSGAGFYQ